MRPFGHLGMRKQEMKVFTLFDDQYDLAEIDGPVFVAIAGKEEAAYFLKSVNLHDELVSELRNIATANALTFRTPKSSGSGRKAGHVLHWPRPRRNYDRQKRGRLYYCQDALLQEDSFCGGEYSQCD